MSVMCTSSERIPSITNKNMIAFYLGVAVNG